MYVDDLTCVGKVKYAAITVQHTDYCNCCNYLAIKVQPVFAISASFNVCSLSHEAPQACSCSAHGLEVNYIHARMARCVLCSSCT